MARKTEDVIEDEVRRRYADLLSSAGVDSGRLNLEVLFLLPSEFVREYVELFQRALRTEMDRSGGGGENATEGKKFTRKPKQGVEGSVRGAQTGGKRYKNHWTIKDEKAFRLKQSVDRRLVRIMDQARRDLEEEEMRSRGKGSTKQRRDAKGRFGKAEGKEGK